MEKTLETKRETREKTVLTNTDIELESDDWT